MADETNKAEGLSADSKPAQETTTQKQTELTFRLFLEQTPPDTTVQITDFRVNNGSLVVPDLTLFCADAVEFGSFTPRTLHLPTAHG